MKKLTFLLVVSIFSISSVFGQCSPDPQYANAGQGIFPRPDSAGCFVNGQARTLSLTFNNINFDSIPGLPSGFTIDTLRIDSIANLPNGLSWQTDKPNNEFLWGDSGCVLISGIPNDIPSILLDSVVGGYYLEAYVTISINMVGSFSTPLSQSPFTSGGSIDSFWYNITLIDSGQPCQYLGPVPYSNRIVGEVFFDANNNGVKDSLDIGMANQKIILNPRGDIHYTNRYGRYEIYLPTGSYTVEMTPPVNYLLSTDSSSYSINFSGPNTINSNNDFGLVPTTFVDEVQVSIDGFIFRPGFFAFHWITYENTGTTIQSGSIDFCPDNIFIVNGASPTWDAQSGGCYSFNFTNLYPGEQRDIIVDLRVPTNVNLLGDTLCSSATVALSQGNNISPFYTEEFCKVVTGSYDPNDKAVMPDDMKNGIAPDQVLDYRIRFQNSGTDTAFTVVVRDTLDQWVDIESVDMVAASHEYQFAIENGNVAVWTFNNILLPDSGVNEAGSHGFIKYRLKLKPTIPQNTFIYNRAAIFFDFNPPIMTNTTQSRTKMELGIGDVEQLSLSVFPNPTDNSATIEWNTHLPNFTFELYDVSGRQVLEQANLSGNRYLLEKGTLQEGFYIYQIKSKGNNIGQGKVVFY